MPVKTKITASKCKVNMPSSRKGWEAWYDKRWGITLKGDHTSFAFTQACWFQLNTEAFGDKSYSPGK